MAADPSQAHLGIIQILGRAFIFALRRKVDFPRAAHAQRLVRPLIVKALTPQIQGGLIALAACFQLAADIAVQSLMGAVVLGMARPAAFQINSQRDPPHRETTQPQQTLHAGKGHAIVTADGVGQAVPGEKLLKTLPHRFAARVLQRPHLQHITAMLVAHRQRLASPPQASPPPFKIHCPHFIGSPSSPPAA